MVNVYPITGKVWYRESTDEWVLELEGSINDTHFISRHTEPGNIAPEDVAGLPSLYKEETKLMTDDPKCVAGCIVFYGGERKHHKDCPYYPESLTKVNADRIEALEKALKDQSSVSDRLAERLHKTEGLLAKAVEDRDHWSDVAHREGVCMTCRGPHGALESYGCTDCLNTGYCGEHHNTVADLEAKLAKAVEALRFYAWENEIRLPSDGPWGAGSTDFGKAARTILAEIKG
jgi:hypothetical protein